jgi:hypothetical protein
VPALDADELQRYQNWLASAGLRYARGDRLLPRRFRGEPFDSTRFGYRRALDASHVGWGAVRGRQVVMFELHVRVLVRRFGHPSWQGSRQAPVLVVSVTLPYRGPVVEVWRDDQVQLWNRTLNLVPEPAVPGWRVLTNAPGHAQRLLAGGLREVLLTDPRAAQLGHLRFEGDQLLTWHHPPGFAASLTRGPWSGRMDAGVAASLLDLLLDLLDALEAVRR